MKNNVVLMAAALAAASAVADDGEQTEDNAVVDELARRVSIRASADVETAYICRGYVWDTRPFSAQDVSLGVDLDPFGMPEATVWTYSPMSSSGHSDSMTRYAYAEVDYLLRYYYDIDIAEGWRLRNGVGRQWVTNPGFRGGRTIVDWQVLQVLHTPWVTPYWRLRVIRRPFDETYWVLGVKRSFDILDDLSFTVDFFGDRLQTLRPRGSLRVHRPVRRRWRRRTRRGQGEAGSRGKARPHLRRRGGVRLVLAVISKV